MNLLATIDTGFWAVEPGTPGLWVRIAVAFLLGVGLIFALMQAPASARRPIVWCATFFAGLFWVLVYLWPEPVNRQPDELPNGAVERVGFWLADAMPTVSNITQVIGGLLLGLGIYSLVGIHSKRVLRKQKDAFFSATLLVSLVAMVTFGYWNWHTREISPLGPEITSVRDNWPAHLFVFDFLFDGLLQQMDAAMFSMIAFFILSAAYRAFRIRSVEATVMMATALIVMLSLMGLVTFWIDARIDGVTGGDAGAFVNNFRLTTVAEWIKDYLQVPSLRALEFGIGLGALAMGLRIWLGLEKGGMTS